MMDLTAVFEAAFLAARSLHKQGKLAEAERAYQQLAGPGEQREIALRALFEL